MSSEPPPGPGGQPPEDDPFRKRPPSDGTGSPYDSPPPHGSTGEPPPYGGSAPPPPGGGGPYGAPPPGGGGPYGAPPPGGGGPHGAPPPGGGGPYGGPPPGGGGDPYGGGNYPTDPLAGMPPLADSGRRTLARIIDMILVGIVVWLLSWAFNVQEYQVDGEDISVGKSFGQSLIAAVLYIAYDTYMTAKTGQTLGKKWLGMRVGNLDNGATPSVQTSLIRALVLWIPFAFCCACVWTIIAGGWSFFDRPYKQGLHDKAAKTVVVSTR
ncbi:RDD family protein [Streptomyces rochei]|uniref:RDD family protein n=3 Tax=Streptomyces TaxID=1883 RepID=UPI00249A0E19|nr:MULTISPECIES: RDD family protein [Streptomyces]MDI3096484.1 RDD family protein [Streptomyces sp. AN-3]WDI18662.1 RDD family protein [Streptomyces enissocaesilis]WQC13147.1 RDD family protein [Streptomyces rochei]